MARKGNDIKDLLTKNESLPTTEDRSEAETQAVSRNKAAKEKESTNTKEYRKKKKDALEGREKRSGKESREEDQKGRRSTREQEKEGRGSGKGGKGSSGSGQGLQSGQTTVQFSSGGGAGLGSLLALFASSANLAKADVGSGLAINANTANLLLRANLQGNTNLTGAFLGEESRALRGVLIGLGDQAAEGLKNKFTIETGTTSSSSNSQAGQDALSALLRNISVTAPLQTEEQSTAPTVQNFSLGGSLVVQTFNSSGVFFNEATQFTFANQSAPYSRDIIIDRYLTDAGLAKTSTYTYQVVSPIASSSEPLYQSWIDNNIPYNSFSATHNPGDLFVTLSNPESITDAALNTGITLTPTGDLLTNALTPTSLLVNVVPAGSQATQGLLVRINAGPGQLITAPNITSIYNVSVTPGTSLTGLGTVSTFTGQSVGLYFDGSNTYSTQDDHYHSVYTYTSTTSGNLVTLLPNLMVGTIDPLNQNRFLSTVLRSSGADTLVGNGESLRIHTDGTNLLVDYTVAHIGVNTYIEEYDYTIRTTSLNGNFVSQVTTDITPTITTLISSEAAPASFRGFTIPVDNDIFTYELPSNTIYRHVGTTLEEGPSAVPTGAAYGNFSGILTQDAQTTAFTTLTLPESPQGFNITFGGNVLDVYGTKYGVGDVLNVILPSEPDSTAINTLTMGGNTIAGFGLGYGDLQKLNIAGSQSSTPDNISPTFINFRSNILYVDKNVDSVLYPHLQDLNLTLDPAGTAETQLNNLTLLFQSNIVHGNAGSDVFFGDIQNLGDLHDPTLYTGFINAVGVSIEQGHYVPGHTELIEVEPEQYVPPVTHEGPGGETIIDEPGYTIPAVYDTIYVEGQFVVSQDQYNPINVVTTASGLGGGDNTIIWANNMYTGGHDLVEGQDISADTYHFTVLSDYSQNPVMTGNHIITDFDITKDILDLQLTPTAFRALDTNHDKFITASDLDQGELIQFTNNQIIIDPMTGKDLGTGTILSFAGGGSLSLVGVDLSNFTALVEANPNEMDPNLLFEVNLTYAPIEAIPPASSDPIVYGQVPFSVVPEHTHLYALDSYFNHSFFATYGTTSSVAFEEGLSIDPYGTITVGNTKPFFTNLTIDATLDPSVQDASSTLQITTTANQTLLMGFLDAPVTYGLAGATQLGYGSGSNSRDILIGDLGSTLVGENTENYSRSISGGFARTGTSEFFGSNLFVGVKPNTTAYGDYQSINLLAEGGRTGSGVNLQNSYSASFGERGNGNALTFQSNAFDVYGSTYGIAQSLNIVTQGGSGIHIPVSNFQHLGTINDSAHFNYNQLNFESQQLLGTGLMVGAIQNINIDVSGGVNSYFDRNGLVKVASGFLDVSGSIIGNEFNFDPSTLTVTIDSANSTLIGSVENLHISLPTIYLGAALRSGSAVSFSINNTATFTDNSFKFGDSYLTGDQVNQKTTYFKGNIQDLGDAYAYSPSNPVYSGFVSGVTVSHDTEGHLIVTDPFNNSIQWGNITYMGSVDYGSLVPNYYYFTLIEDRDGNAVMQGYDQIMNFNPLKDQIVFNIDATLFKDLGMSVSDSQNVLATKLNSQVSLVTNGNSIHIAFNGGGVLDYGALTLNMANSLITNQTTLQGLQAYPTTYYGLSGITNLPIIIQQLGTAYIAPEPIPIADVVFDPVFLASSSADLAFLSFTNANPLRLTWSVTGGADGSITLPSTTVDNVTTYTVAPGITFNSLGFLDTSGVTSLPVDAYMTVSFKDRQSDAIAIPTQHIFAIDASDSVIHRVGDEGNAEDSQAFEISSTDPGTYITIGGGGDLIDPNSFAPIVYGSKLIYDTSVGTGIINIAIGDIQNISFSNQLDQNITFNPNMFNVDTTGGGAIYGNVQTISLNDSNNNYFTFGGNTVFSNGPSIYSSVATLSMNSGSAANVFAFADSVVNPGTAAGSFFTDIGDLSDTNFVQEILSSATNSNFADPINGQVIIQDIQGNVISWGNTTFNTAYTAAVNTFNFNILSYETGPGTIKGVLQGNSEIAYYKTTDVLAFKLAPDFFKEVITGYNRVATKEDLAAAAHFTNTGSGTLLTFADGTHNYGSITFDNYYITSFAGMNVTVGYSYIPTEPITIADNNPLPLIFNPTGGQAGNGTYGNVLDQYYNNLALGSTLETYTVANKFDQLSLLSDSALGTVDLPNHQGTQANLPNNISLTTTNRLFFATGGTTTMLDQFGTGLGFSTTPLLALITISPYDLYTSAQGPSLDLVVGEFEGTTITDTNTVDGGTVMSTEQSGSYLYGLFGEETMIGGNSASLVLTPTYIVGTDYYGNNMIINTNSGNTVYGVAQDISMTVNVTNARNYDYGANAIYALGTIYGTANSYTLDVSGSNVMNYTTNIFGPTTIYGEGTIYGNLQTFTINAANGLNENVFLFAPTQIAITGSDYSTIFTNIDEFIFTRDATNYNVRNNNFIFSDSVVVAGSGGSEIYSTINDLTNTPFWNTIVTAGDTNEYGVLYSNTDSDHISAAFINSSSYPNVITWGNNTFYLGDGLDTIHLNILNAVPISNSYDSWSSGSGTPYPVMPGNITIYDFDYSNDAIIFNIAPDTYATIRDGVSSMTPALLGEVTYHQTSRYTTSNIHVTNPDANTLQLQFYDSSQVGFVSTSNTFGQLIIHSDTGAPSTLAGLDYSSHLGTSFFGVDGTAETFSFFVPVTDNHVGTDLAAFTEMNNIHNFNLSEDYLHIALPTSVYQSFSSDHTTSGTIDPTLLPTSLGSPDGGITSDYNAITGDSTIYFSGFGQNPSGDIVLHDFNLSAGLSETLGSHLRFGWIEKGTAGEVNTTPGENFYVGSSTTTIDSNDFSQFNHILDFASQDHLTITISESLFHDLGGEDPTPISNPSGTPVTASALQTNTMGAHVNVISQANAEFTPTYDELHGSGTINSILSGNATVDTVLQFIAADGLTISGTLTLHNVNLNGNLSSLNSQLTIAHA